ncbi:BQ2448_4855 [Microbotryum intermedium]|uniref:BQ2448_4855 protein n=1 Tax=Microbotryum intermedium TaxID=269621 RepID=A0A238FJ30_9BASI|nr:BQ2448_4855 [Microbotryum intermedium]
MPENQRAPSIRSFRSDRGPRTSSSATPLRDRTSFASAYHYVDSGSGGSGSGSTSAYPSSVHSHTEPAIPYISPRTTTLSRVIQIRPKSPSGASLHGTSSSGHGTFATADQEFSNLGAGTSGCDSGAYLPPRPDAYRSSSTSAVSRSRRAPDLYHGHTNVDRLDHHHDDVPPSSSWSASSHAERSYERETTFLKYKIDRSIPTFERTYTCVQRESPAPASGPGQEPSSHPRRPAIEPHQKHPSIDSGYGGSHHSYCSTSPNDAPAPILVTHDSSSALPTRHTSKPQFMEKELPSEYYKQFSSRPFRTGCSSWAPFVPHSIAVPVDYEEQPLPPLPQGPTSVAGSGLWNRLTSNLKSTVMHATTISKDSFPSSYATSDPTEEDSTPDSQGESRLSRVIRDYHFIRAEMIEDVPEWLIDEDEMKRRQGCRRYSVQTTVRVLPQNSHQTTIMSEPVLQLPPKDLPMPGPCSRSSSDGEEEDGATWSNGRYRISGGNNGTRVPSSRSIEKLLKMRAEERLKPRGVV